MFYYGDTVFLSEREISMRIIQILNTGRCLRSLVIGGDCFYHTGGAYGFFFFWLLDWAHVIPSLQTQLLSAIRGGMVMTSGVAQIVRAIEKQILYLLLRMTRRDLFNTIFVHCTE